MSVSVPCGGGGVDRWDAAGSSGLGSSDDLEPAAKNLGGSAVSFCDLSVSGPSLVSRPEASTQATGRIQTVGTAGLDDWVAFYSHDRDHQGIGDVPPIRRFELADRSTVEVVDGEMEITEEQESKSAPVVRRVDSAGRISILKHRYHVGRYLAGQAVTVESSDGLLHVSHNGVVVATHARRHLPEDDTRMDRRVKPSHPKPATLGSEVLRIVDSSGGISFAGTGYRVGNGYRGQTVGVRIVADTVQVSQDGILIRTHRARHDPAKEHGALARPNGKPLRKRK